MANIKTGFLYYPVSSDRYSDRRIIRLKKDMGCRGLAVYDYIMCEIFRTNGCYMLWGESTVLVVAEYFGLSDNAVMEVVRFCGSVGLFDKKLLSRGVITSEEIQRRYMEMCIRARRKNYGIPEGYLLIRAEEKCEPVAKADVQGQTRPAVLDIEEEIRTLMSEELWLDQLQILHGVSKDVMKEKLKGEFKAQCIAGGINGHSSIRDAKSHFNNWMFRQKQNSNGNQRELYNQRRPTEVTATSAKDFEGSF